MINAAFYSWAGCTGGLTPSHGEAFINGRDVQTELGQVRSITGICSQDNLLYEELSGLEHLEMYARFRGSLFLGVAAPRLNADESSGVHDVDAEASELLDTVGLTKHADKRAVAYSGGMQRRLSVAIAYVGRPTVIYLDEPTTGV